jgi:hypothetical protein
LRARGPSTSRGGRPQVRGHGSSGGEARSIRRPAGPSLLVGCATSARNAGSPSSPRSSRRAWRYPEAGPDREEGTPFRGTPRGAPERGVRRWPERARWASLLPRSACERNRFHGRPGMTHARSVVARRAPSGSLGVQNREKAPQTTFNRVAPDFCSCTVRPPPPTSGWSEGRPVRPCCGGTFLQSSHVGGEHRE